MTAVNEIEVASSSRAMSAFSSASAFEGAQRMAKLLCASDMVPQSYRNNIANAVIALEVAQQIGMPVLTCMQNLYIVHGKPSWSSSFLIACINGCGRYASLRYEFSGKEGGDDRACVAWTIEKSSGEKLEGPKVSIAMAKAEGWFGKNGSKWQTMPELMLRYRAATLFARTYCPELTMGMHTAEEAVDAGAKEAEAVVVDTKTAAVHEKLLQRREDKAQPAVAIEPEAKPVEQPAAPAPAPAPLPKNAAAGKAAGEVADARRVAWINEALLYADSETAQAIRELMDGRTPQEIAADSSGFVAFKAKVKGWIDAATAGRSK